MTTGDPDNDADTLLEILCSKIASATNEQRKDGLLQIADLVGLGQSYAQDQHHDKGVDIDLKSTSEFPRKDVVMTVTASASKGKARYSTLSTPPPSSTPSLTCVLRACSSRIGFDIRTVLLRGVSKILSESAQSLDLFSEDAKCDTSACFQSLVESLKSSLHPSNALKASLTPVSVSGSPPPLSITALKCAAASLKAIHSFFNYFSSRKTSDASAREPAVSIMLLQAQQVSELVSLLLEASSSGVQLESQSQSSSGSSAMGSLATKRDTKRSGISSRRPSDTMKSGRLGSGMLGVGGALEFANTSTPASIPTSASAQKAFGVSNIKTDPPSSPSGSQSNSDVFSSLKSKSSNTSLKELHSRTKGQSRSTQEDEDDTDGISSASEIAGSRALGSDSESGSGAANDGDLLREQGDTGRKKRLGVAARGVRMNALACIVTLNEHAPQQVFSHWNSLLPESLNLISAGQSASTSFSRSSRVLVQPSSSSLSSSSFSLFTLIERDPALSVRIAAAHAIEALLSKGSQKGWLSAAEERSTRVASFTSLSARLGSIVVGLRSKIATFLSPPLGCVRGPARSRSNSAVSVSSVRAGQHGIERINFSQPAALLEIVLRLAKCLVSSTSTAKLKQTHMEVFRQPVLSLCSHPEPAIAVAAYSLLSALISTPSGGATPRSGSGNLQGPFPMARDDESKPSDTESHAIKEVLSQLDHHETSEAVNTQLWSTLAAFAENRREALRPHEARIMALLGTCLLRASEKIRQGAATFLLAILRSQAEEASNLTKIRALPRSSQAFHSVAQNPHAQPSELSKEQSQVLTGIVYSVKNDDSPIVRTLLADSLPYWDTILRSSQETHEDVKTKALLLLLLRDVEAAVRAAAVRALGVILMDGLKFDFGGATTDEASSSVESTLEFSSRALLEPGTVATAGALNDRALLVQIRASWTLANLCEVYFAHRCHLVSSRTSRSYWFSLLQAALSASFQEERVSLNSLRAFGALFGSMSSDQLKSAQGQQSRVLTAAFVEAINKLCSVVWVNSLSQTSGSQGPSPKIKWNAASSLGRALGSEEARRLMSDTTEKGESLLSKAIFALSSSLHSKTFKVKLSATHALLQIAGTSWSNGSLVSAEALETARESCGSALGTIDDLIRDASFSEANLHGGPCKVALKKLKDGLDEAENRRLN